MDSISVFLSHTSKDDAFVVLLRRELAQRNLKVWDDAQKLRGGDDLPLEVKNAIEAAETFISLLSGDAINSGWVLKELEWAKQVQQNRPDYRIIPLRLPGVQRPLIKHLLGKEPIDIEVKTTDAIGLQDALPAILTALGLQLPGDQQAPGSPPEAPVDELVLQLSDPEIYTEGGLRRGRAKASLVFQPADTNKRPVESKTFIFTSPLGPIEAGDLKWYIEEYPGYSYDFYEKRAGEISHNIPVWGKQLLDALTEHDNPRSVLDQWRSADGAMERRFSIEMDAEPPIGADAEARTAAYEAASALLSLPWETLHDGRGYLFQGRQPVRVRRRLPNREALPAMPLQPVLRILLLSPRPEEEGVGFIDHRVSPKALLDAVEPLGSLAELHFLDTPTFPALSQKLKEAERAGKPFTVVHFDGHGVFDRVNGLGALCFESPEAQEQAKPYRRKLDLVRADQIAAELRGYRIPLFFLDACQTAQTELDPTASVAATLLENGVASVAAMSHSVLVETARRFAVEFYKTLAAGARIGSAMLAGQQALHADPHRADLPGGKQLRLQDWFVPVLYQEENDPQIVKKIPAEATQRARQEGYLARLGALPAEPQHQFVGRSRDLLAAERLLRLHPWLVIRGAGGAGKTTLAAELARWLLRTGRCEQVAFVSLETYTDPRSALDALGRQLLPDQPDWSVAKYAGEAEAFLHIQRALQQSPCLLLLDNLESVLPLPGGEPLPGVAPVEEFIAFFKKLQGAAEHTRLLFTTRERLPAPFDRGDRELPLGALSEYDAVRLVAQVMRTEGLSLPTTNHEDLLAQFRSLVEGANYHARALTLLAREIAQYRGGLQGLNTDLRSLMAELERRHPGNRENSLFAGVELSLRRLPPQAREVVDALAVYHGGADVATWAMVAECEQDAVAQVAMALVQVGLAEVALDQFPYYFTIDPALPAHLLRQTAPTALAAMEARWTEGMAALASFLYQQRSQDIHLAARLSRLAEPNLLRMLSKKAASAEAEELVDLADTIERLFQNLARPQSLAHATRIREAAAARLGTWSHARFVSESAAADRFFEQGDLRNALATAEKVYRQCLAAGDAAYSEAAYDAALAHYSLGRMLNESGNPEPALPLTEEARRRFLVLAAAGNADAAEMAAKCLTQKGDCLLDAGRWEAAAAAYLEAIAESEKLEDWRQVAVAKGQLATVRYKQKRHGEALELYAEVMGIFKRLGEESSVAAIWHQIAMTHQGAGQPKQAEKAYLQSLNINTQLKNPAGEALTLIQLGNLYKDMHRLEDAVQMYQRAAEIHVRLKDMRWESAARSNLANTLIQLGRYEDARREILRAIACKSQFGVAAEPWLSWAILYNLETASGNPAAAADARAQAIEAYAAYRAQGGESRSNRYNFITGTFQAIQAGEEKVLAEYLQSTLEPGDPPTYEAFIRQLLALLQGERSAGLAEDPALNYIDAVELRLLIEELGQG